MGLSSDIFHPPKPLLKLNTQDLYPVVTLKPGKIASVKRFHPWIFSGAIKKIYGDPKEGDVVEIHDENNLHIATGQYHKSSIAIRILTFNQEEINYPFWVNKIRKAFQFRIQSVFPQIGNTNVYRLIHGEGDGLSGLIVDYYNGVAVMQCHSIGMFRNREIVVKALHEVLGNKLIAIYDKSESTVNYSEAPDSKNSFLLGNFEGRMNILENGNSFLVDWLQGQKTGFFIDQRENRKLLGQYSGGKKVANIFGYTGGFSIYALKAGASQTITVDSSKKAIESCIENVELNFKGAAPHIPVCGDAFDYLNQMDNSNEIIVLDPPAFAKHSGALHNALQAYKRINQKAIEKIQPGGMIFTFSCSQAVNKEEFRKSVFAGAANSGREVRILHQLIQPPDHPVSIYHPEGEYLKGLIIQVE